MLDADARGELALEDPLAGRLVADLQSAVRLLLGDTSTGIVPLPQPGVELVRQPLITLNGTAIFAAQ